MDGYVGIFRLLAVTPVWAAALFILVLCSPLGIMFVLADRSTGLFFNVSYSGVIGDMLLTIAILIGVTVLKRGAPLPTIWYGHSTIWPQIIWLLVCVAVGITLFISPSHSTPLTNETLPDRYHNLVVVPVYLFLVPAMALVIVYNGTVAEIVIGLLLVAIWACLVWFDYDNNRLNQPEYVHQRFGLHFQAGRIVENPNHRHD